jgi:hypothetical protein
MKVNNELEKIYNEAVVAYFKVLEGLIKPQKTTVRIAGISAETRLEHLPKDHSINVHCSQSCKP